MQAPDTTIIVEPSTRSFADWTPDLLRAARVMADSGNLALAADLCDAMMGDDRIMASLNTRCKGLVGLPLRFESATGTKRLVDALEGDGDWWAAFSEDSLSQLLKWGIFLGVGLAKIVWTDRGSPINRIVPRLEVWSPKHLRYDWNTRTWWVKTAGNVEVLVTPGDGTWILYTPYGENRPWAHGAWRGTALWFLLKLYAIEDWARYSERHGQGTVVIESPEQSDKEKRKDLAESLQQAGRDAVVVLPAGFRYSLVEAVANTAQTFVDQKNAADLGAAVAILGQNLSTEVSGPVSTGMTLHGRVLQIYIDGDAETFSTCLRDQALVWWAEFNFGERESPWPKWDTKPPANKRELADLGKTMVGTGVFTINEVRVAAGYEPLQAGGDELAQAPSMFGEEDEAGYRTIRLRSGRRVRRDAGIVQGQLYADAVADNARERAAEALQDDVAEVLDAISQGESYDDVRKRLVKAYRAMKPEKLAEIVERATVMADLAGRHAVNEDG